MAQNIVVLGSLNMDFAVRVEHLPAPGETVLGSGFRMNPGGKGANQACAAGKLAGSNVRVRMHRLLLCLAASVVLHAAPPASDGTDLLPDENLTGWTRVPVPPINGVTGKLQWRVDPAQKVLICSGDGAHADLENSRIGSALDLPESG